MDKLEMSSLLATIINFAFLIGVVVVIVKLVKSFTNKSRVNSNIEQKLDKIIELLDKKEDSK